MSQKLLVTVLAVCAFIGGAMLIAGATFLASDDAESTEAEVYLLSLEQPDTPSSPVLDGAKHVDRLSDIPDSAKPMLLILDESSKSTVDRDALADLAKNGSAVIGLNIPLDELVDMTSFAGTIGEINLEFQENLNAEPATFEGPFFTLVWRTPPGADPAHWGTSQKEFTDLYFSAIVSRQKLLVRGLVEEGDRVIPLENYGRD